MRCSFLIAAAALLATPAAAQAACTPQFDSDTEAVNFSGVVIEANGSASQDVAIGVLNPGAGPPGDGETVALVASEPCVASIRVNQVATGLNPDFPPYHLLFGGQEIQILPPGAGSSGTDLPIANVPSGGLDLSFQFVAETEWGLASGTQLDQLELSLLNEQGGVVDTLTLSLAIEIPKAASLSVVGTVSGVSGGTQIDLGVLSATSETVSPPFGALILSTSPYEVGFSSASAGNLLHADGVATIPYRLYFDGRQVDLASRNTFLYPQHTPGQGDYQPMSIVVPAVPGVLAGSYSDRVTMTVTAM